ncbi:relaxase/mobilization nuclease domain-containing protein [Longicatena caecimuris]|uniref:Relaxase/mobilization nuclease-like protein n=1 Tax=Longicatena caecimuris TaxID=1796635 RepID=A0A4R3TMF1_9FIRM|nr:relaxase/mobilization nuclease domain-containing protein [Longicatena caecimuris]MCR1869491.1 relaxase/mobilization nuclease domain-containing protein [Longicatena caecimuris]MCU0102250.1 relaxase/mobilization nuclease domain-containing protein [Longicatena caecimuris]TCU62504.1 relaxase/mobilization nuclease-like protein [Longicatena caecimuris]
MATFKHISSKNADYGAAEQYLTFEHDEFTMKPTLDGNGRLVLRDDYRISSLNCGEEDFAIACMRSNLKYGKNQKREDVKSHHYIISFDPRDAPDNGLTVDRAQELGEQFCKEHFPGHQALVCTHPDGHNHSGNIHVHIVINSLRIAEVPLLPYMERPADTREGCKHRCTDAAMEYFKAEVMEMCHRENLYQIDLLNGSKNRITEREYWAKRKGQAALDKENASQATAGEPTKQTKFETDKEKLRQTIRKALVAAATFDDFSSLLLREGVTVKESRGRLSYLTPDRTKPITARKLGDDFDRAAILETLTINAQNAARAAETPTPKQEYPRSIKDRLQRNKAAINAPKQDGVQCMVDIAAKKAEGKGKGYEKWATLYNLKQMAATVSVYEESGFSSPEELEAALAAASAGLHETTGKLKAVESTLREKKDLQKQLLAYIKTKPARDGLRAQKTEKARRAYREQHESEFIISESAARYFKAQGIPKLPASKTLQAEIEQLTKEKNALYNEYREKKENVRELQTVKSNLDKILRREPERGKGRENER